MVVGLITDQSRPVCSETWPGNATDVTTLIPVVDRVSALPWAALALSPRR
jgi:hypothetical protein